MEFKTIVKNYVFLVNYVGISRWFEVDRFKF